MGWLLLAHLSREVRAQVEAPARSLLACFRKLFAAVKALLLNLLVVEPSLPLLPLLLLRLVPLLLLFPLLPLLSFPLLLSLLLLPLLLLLLHAQPLDQLLHRQPPIRWSSRGRRRTRIGRSLYQHIQI